MSNLTAQLRLKFHADTGPIAKAVGAVRGLRRGLADLSGVGGLGGSGGAFAGLGGRASQALGLPQAKGAFRLASDIGLAANAMQQFRGQLTAVTKGPIDAFANLELMLARVKGRTEGITGEGFARLERAAKDAGASTTFTATEAAEGLFELAGAGLNVEQQIGALRPVLRLAQASQIGLGQASAIATNTMAQFGLTVKDIPTISDLLNQAANASTIELGELGDTMRYVGPIANASGLSLSKPRRSPRCSVTPAFKARKPVPHCAGCWHRWHTKRPAPRKRSRP